MRAPKKEAKSTRDEQCTTHNNRFDRPTLEIHKTILKAEHMFDVLMLLLDVLALVRLVFFLLLCFQQIHCRCKWEIGGPFFVQRLTFLFLRLATDWRWNADLYFQGKGEIEQELEGFLGQCKGERIVESVTTLKVTLKCREWVLIRAQV
jgi:hypothetical protein